MASTQLQACAMGPGKGEEVGIEEQGPEQLGGKEAIARCAVREPKVPRTKPHNTHLLDRPQRTSRFTKEQRSRDRKDLPRVTQEGVEKLALRAPSPDV